jgi:acetyl-CoA C-acetyltransferase
MKSIYLGAQTVMAGTNELVVTGGFESMSNIPFYLPKARTGYGYGHGQLLDGVVHDGLWDSFDNHHMGSAAEVCAEKYQLTREDQDAYALESYARAMAATEGGLFAAEIAPVTIPQRRGDPKIVSVDEEPAKGNPAKFPALRAAFKKDGTVTAANASSLNDGAAAVIVSSQAYADSRSLKPMARIIGFGDAAHEPVMFTTAPALAVPVALARAGLTPADVDLWELNEAFSVVALANNNILGLDPSKVNINGGAVALGHPIGASGARIVVTLLHALQQQDKTIGVAAICNGGGGASAIVVERLV